MAELHRRHLGLDGPTDVLTFDATVGEGPIDVDIVVCLDEAVRARDGTSVSVEQELLLYAVHGVLHCAGFNDTDEAASRAMHAEEGRVLRAIGQGDLYRMGMEP